MHGSDRHKRHGIAVAVLIVAAIILLHGVVAALVWQQVGALALDGPLAHGLIGLVILAILAKLGYLVVRHFKNRGAPCPS